MYIKLYQKEATFNCGIYLEQTYATALSQIKSWVHLIEYWSLHFWLAATAQCFSRRRSFPSSSSVWEGLVSAGEAWCSVSELQPLTILYYGWLCVWDNAHWNHLSQNWWLDYVQQHLHYAHTKRYYIGLNYNKQEIITVINNAVIFT